MAQYSHLFVVLMGMGTVFVGLICIIFLMMITGKILGNASEAPALAATAASTPAPVPSAAESELVAVITTALAHELDCSPTGLRIMSIKKLS